MFCHVMVRDCRMSGYATYEDALQAVHEAYICWAAFVRWVYSILIEP
jgi:hypothetical protein